MTGEKQVHRHILYLVLCINMEKILILAHILKSMCAFNDVMVLFLPFKCVFKLIMHLKTHFQQRKCSENQRDRPSRAIGSPGS